MLQSRHGLAFPRAPGRTLVSSPGLPALWTEERSSGLRRGPGSDTADSLWAVSPTDRQIQAHSQGGHHPGPGGAEP